MSPCSARKKEQVQIPSEPSHILVSEFIRIHASYSIACGRNTTVQDYKHETPPRKTTSTKHHRARLQTPNTTVQDYKHQTPPCKTTNTKHHRARLQTPNTTVQDYKHQTPPCKTTNTKHHRARLQARNTTVQDYKHDAFKPTSCVTQLYKAHRIYIYIL